ncbi:hypothetical protein ACFS6H_19975 [Terrimonas rubra]|uniref:Uncharacterized protein n=1 Tax=Terrimonas rubra TaxID=1035890 RepID=A0ABW6A9D8_9BACT
MKNNNSTENYYKNPFHNPNYTGSKPQIKIESAPIEYKGYLIYERIKYTCFDVVKDGVCVGMYAGKNGAMRFIDKTHNT